MQASWQAAHLAVRMSSGGCGWAPSAGRWPSCLTLPSPSLAHTSPCHALTVWPLHAGKTLINGPAFPEDTDYLFSPPVRKRCAGAASSPLHAAAWAEPSQPLLGAARRRHMRPLPCACQPTCPRRTVYRPSGSPHAPLQWTLPTNSNLVIVVEGASAAEMVRRRCAATSGCQ